MKATSADVYSIWNTDNNGNYTDKALFIASGSSFALKSFESSFQQDLNGDGKIGLSAQAIGDSAALLDPHAGYLLFH